LINRRPSDDILLLFLSLFLSLSRCSFSLSSCFSLSLSPSQIETTLSVFPEKEKSVLETHVITPNGIYSFQQPSPSSPSLISLSHLSHPLPLIKALHVSVQNHSNLFDIMSPHHPVIHIRIHPWDLSWSTNPHDYVTLTPVHLCGDVIRVTPPPCAPYDTPLSRL
jgi:hypothetical protein